MEALRIREKNITTETIREIDVYIHRNETTIERFRKQSTLSTFESTQITKMTLKNTEYASEKTRLNQKLLDIAAGLFDKDFLANSIEQQDRIIISNEKIKAKNNAKMEKKKEDQKFIKKSYMNDYSQNSEKYMDKELQRFYRNCDSLPDYIKRNLSEMPNNKGYIWKGVWFMGDLPAEKNSNQTIMFEKLRGGILRIRETDPKGITIYEKEGKNRKEFVSYTPRSEFYKKIINDPRLQF